MHLAILVGVWLSVGLAGVKAFWLFRIWKVVRNVRVVAPPSGSPERATNPTSRPERDDVLVTQFEVIRKVTRR